MKTSITVHFLCIAALSIILLTGCASSGDTIDIGYIGPLTGPSAVLGMDVVPALEIAIESANNNGGVRGKHIQLFIEDDQYTTAKTVTAYEKLVHANGVKVILLSTYGGLFALAERAEQDGVILIDVLDCNRQIAALNDNVLCLATETESIGQTIAEYANAKDQRRSAIFYTNRDSFMTLVKDAYVTTSISLGVSEEDIQEILYLPQERDFKTQITKALEADPDVLVLLGHDEIGVLMKQARELGFKGEFLATGVVTSPSLQKASQGHSEGTVFAYWDANSTNPLAAELNQKFEKRVGRTPLLPLTTHPAYDTMNILLEDVLPIATTTKDIRSAWIAVEQRSGVTGTITIRSDGTFPIPESPYRLENGMPVQIQ